MPGVCKTCGLPLDLCVCESLARARDKIVISTEEKRFKKALTLVSGLSKDVDTRTLLRDLKQKLACGGTIKNGVLELQGKHKEKIRDLLIKSGFSAEQIEIR